MNRPGIRGRKFKKALTRLLPIKARLHSVSTRGTHGTHPGEAPAALESQRSDINAWV